MKLSYVPLDAFRYADTLHPVQRAELYAALNRINVLYMVKRAGSGHIGSSFSAMDIVTWIMLNEPDAIFFSSKGHDAPAFYATLISLGRLPFDYLHKLRRPDGLPGHPTVDIPGCHVNSGSLGMGISKAKGMILANRLNGVTQRVIVLVGDGEMQEGQNWEALRTIDDYPELTVIVDENRMQSDGETLENVLCDIQLFADAPYPNGHDMSDIENCLGLNERIIIAGTAKGKGVSFMERLGDDGLYHYHSGAPSDKDYALAFAELAKVAYDMFPALKFETVEVETVIKQPNPLIQAYSDALVEAGKDPRVVVLDADLMVDCGLKAFRDAYPDRYFECGIAEQDMVSMAGAMARKGFIPFVHSFAAFLTRRALDQIYNNCTEGDKVIYVGSLAGSLGETGPGKSHESLDDGTLMLTMPGMGALEPQTPKRVVDAVRGALSEAWGPLYIRLLASGGMTQ